MKRTGGQAVEQTNVVSVNLLSFVKETNNNNRHNLSVRTCMRMFDTPCASMFFCWLRQVAGQKPNL